MEDFITRTKPAAEEYLLLVGVDGSTEQVEKPEYHNWRLQDLTLLGWLLSSISEDTLSLVITCMSSFDVWRTLEKKYGVQSSST